MRNISNWPAGPVNVYAARVTVDGETTPAESISVSREIPSPLPGQVSTVGGLSAAQGSVEWAQAEDATTRVPTPWTSGDYPSRGEAVEVYASMDGAEARIFTGLTDGGAGQFSSPDHSTSLVDYADRLDRPFRMDALSRIMPPWEFDTGNIRRLIGLHPAYFTDRVLRAAGFYITPPMDPFCVASVPLIGSLWPERGSLRHAYRTEDEFGARRYNPRWSYEPSWGSMSVQDGVAIVRPDVTVYSGRITDERPLTLTMMVGTYHQTSAYVAAAWSGGTRQIRLAVTSARALIAQTRDENDNVVSLVGITETEAPGYKAASLRVEAVNATEFRYRLRTDTGVEKTATAVRVPGTGSDPVDQFWVYAPNNRIAGAQMSFTSGSWIAVNYKQTARMSYPSSTVQLDAIPGIDSGTCRDHLSAQSEAEGAAFWIDEDGVAQWRTRGKFTDGPVARDLTAAQDLLDVAFRLDGQDVRRKVTVSYRKATVSTAQKYTFTVHESARAELEVGDVKEEWVQPGADEDWLLVDDSQDTIIGGGGTGPFNKGERSFVGFTGIRAADDEESIENIGFERVMTFSKVGPTSWRFYLTLTKLPTGISKVTTTSIENPALKDRYRGLGLPLVRAKGVVKWTTETYTPGLTGPAWAPELEHNISWFVQDPAEVKALADWIAAQLANPQPVIESLDIIPDARLQIGDKVRVSDPARTGVEVTGVVIAVTHKISDGDHAMTLRLLVTEVTAQGVTLDEFDAFYSGMTLDEVETLLTPRTLDDVDAYPLTD